MRAMNGTPEGQLALEAPAFCAQVRWEAEATPHLATDPDEAVEHYTHTLRLYPHIRHLPLDQEGEIAAGDRIEGHLYADSKRIPLTLVRR